MNVLFSFVNNVVINSRSQRQTYNEDWASSKLSRLERRLRSCVVPQPTRSCLPVPFTFFCTSTVSYSVCWLFSSGAIATERRRTEWRKWASHKKPFCRRWWHVWLWVVPYHKLDTSASFVIRVSGTISFLEISWELPFPARVSCESTNDSESFAFNISCLNIKLLYHSISKF